MDFETYCARYGYTGLTDVQKQAVQAVDGPVLLFAVPGSGKTTTLVARLGYMLLCRGIDARNLLVITFSRSAAAEMKRRFMERFHTDEAGTPTFRTIHAHCSGIIRRAAALGLCAEPAVEENTIGHIRAVCQELYGYLDISVLTDILSRIGKAKNTMTTPEGQADCKGVPIDLGRVYNRYRERLRAAGKIDFDDMLSMACSLLEQHPQLLGFYVERFRYISVDEAQDTSPLQHKIIDLLGTKYGNVFMVGDDDQCIYSFRGADPRGLLSFPTRYRGALRLRMEINYRSDTKIVRAADSFIAVNKNREPKRMTARSAEPGEVIFVDADDCRSMLDHIAERAKAATGSLAVLYRTNDSAPAVRHVLEREGVPCRILAEKGAADRSKTLRDLTNILEFALDRSDYARYEACYSNLGLYLDRGHLDFIRDALAKDASLDILDIVNRYLSGFGRNPRDAKLAKQKDRLKVVRVALNELTDARPAAALNLIRNKLGYADKLRVNAPGWICSDGLSAVAEDCASVPAFLRRLKELCEPCAASGNVVLATMHAAKGMEFDEVLLIDLIDDLIPGRDDPNEDLRDREARLEDEARLFYVGMTRARHRLELVSCLHYNDSFRKPSRFLRRLRGSVPGAARADNPAAKAPARGRGALASAYGRPVGIAGGYGQPVGSASDASRRSAAGKGSGVSASARPSRRTAPAAKKGTVTTGAVVRLRRGTTEASIAVTDATLPFFKDKWTGDRITLYGTNYTITGIEQ